MFILPKTFFPFFLSRAPRKPTPDVFVATFLSSFFAATKYALLALVHFPPLPPSEDRPFNPRGPWELSRRYTLSHPLSSQSSGPLFFPVLRHQRTGDRFIAWVLFVYPSFISVHTNTRLDFILTSFFNNPPPCFEIPHGTWCPVSPLFRV